MNKTTDKHFWDSDTKDTLHLLEYQKQNGAVVLEGESVCEIEATKATMYFHAKSSGVLEQVLKEGDEVDRSQCVFEIDNMGTGETIQFRLIDLIQRIIEQVHSADHASRFAKVAASCSLTKLHESIVELMDNDFDNWLGHIKSSHGGLDVDRLFGPIGGTQETVEVNFDKKLFNMQDEPEEYSLDALVGKHHVYEWLISGGVVYKEEEVCELEGIKAVFGIRSPATGIVVKFPSGHDVLKAGQKLFEVRPLSTAESYNELLKTSAKSVLAHRFGIEKVSIVLEKIRTIQLVHLEETLPILFTGELDEIVLELGSPGI